MAIDLSDNCGCEQVGPEFILNPAIGTAPCPTGVGVTSTTPCPPQACCNFWRTEEADGSNNFIFSAGGPFALGTSGVLVDTPGFQRPGILGGIVCVPDLPPGTYRIDTRMELRGVPAGGFVDVVVLPDCTDTSVSYMVSECVNSGADTESWTCDGFLYITIDGCNPGFEILNCSTAGALQNFQISFTRISGRTLVDCGGSLLVPVADTDITCVGGQ